MAAQNEAQQAEIPRVDPPQVLIDAGLQPVEYGGLAERVGMSWPEVLASIEPAPWPQSEKPDPIEVIPADVASLLQESESASEKGELFHAVQLLQQAETLSSGHPKVLRALGLAYAESGNLTRAASYLGQIVSNRRDDADVLLLLARHAAQSRAIQETLTYCKALEQAQVSALAADYYRSIVLSELGYATAAADRMTRVIQAVAEIAPDDLKVQAKVAALSHRERLVLRAMAPQLRIRRGDLLLKSGALDLAEQAYASVELEDAAARHRLIARRAYLALRADDQLGAMDLVLSLFSDPHARVEDAQLIAYLVDQDVSPKVLTERIEAMVQVNGITLPSLVALSQVAEKSGILRSINRWLATAPVTPERLAKAVSLIRFDDHEPAEAKALADLLELVVNLMQQSPDQAYAYANAAVDQVDAPITLLRAIRSDAFTADLNDYTRLVSAVAYERTDRQRDALVSYEPLLAAGGVLKQQVLLPTIRLQLALGRGDKAHEQLGEPKADADWSVFELSVRAMSVAGKAREAGALIDERIKARGKQIHLEVLRIETIAQIGRPQEACNLLLRLISSQPSDESLYLLGVDLTYKYHESFHRTTDADLMRRAFLTRLISNLPDSALARIARAQNIMSNPARIDEAEQILLNVIQDEPDNTGAMASLVELYDAVGEEVGAQAMHERMTQVIGPGAVRALIVADRAIALGQMQRATKVVDEVFELDEQGVLPGPAMTGDQASSLLHYLEAADAERETDGLYLSMVRRFPDHAGLNNALGYRWAFQNKNLLQAKAMIERALKDDPMNHSILDSFAWVQYKLGQFEEAKGTQNRALMVLEVFTARNRVPGGGQPANVADDYAASIAILNDHMGDILYKLGDTRKALEHWRVAMKQSYGEEEMRFDPELRTLSARLKAKIEALADAKPAPVAEVPGPESHGPEGHPADQKPEDRP